MKVVIFGSTGAIGRSLIEIISKEEPSWMMFAVTRGSVSTDKFNGIPNLEVVQGDPNDSEQTMKLSVDKDIVFSCVGFERYEAKYWAQHWPIVVDNLLAASSQNDHQKFIFCDNLYAYGPSVNISSSSPRLPPSNRSKPGVRVLIHQKLEQRMKAKPGSIAVVGGADFFGRYVTKTSFLGDTFTKAIVLGSPAPICIGSASVVHDFCYVPDFARALYLVSRSEKGMGKFWICPHSIHNKNLQQIATDVGRLAASQNSKVTVYPGWSVRLLSPFMGFMWEMIEMLPFWTKDYRVDDSDFCKAFGIEATPYEEALTAYIQFYKAISETN